MKIRRVMFAAVKSGSGKTTITCAMLHALKEQNQRVRACKCGPDYIDPMFHEKVIGIPSTNLDTFFTGEEGTRNLFLENHEEDDLVIMEGVMGLFDGLGGVCKEGSSYHLAEVTNTPIILVIDAKGMGQSVFPLIAGFLSYDPKHLIRGIIFNKMSKHYYEILKPRIEKEFPIRVVGYVPENKSGMLSSRHLGLVLPNEVQGLKEQIAQIASQMKETVSVAAILAIAEQAVDLQRTGKQREVKAEQKEGPTIGVALDEAFCFYYKDNLKLLQTYGAKLQVFSPLHDSCIPKECDGLLIGGGYPELYAEALSDNKSMHASIRQAFERGMPLVAECGGFMYLHEAMLDQNGKHFPMAGVISGETFYTGKTVRFGYIEIQEQENDFLERGTIIRGHEFHYYDSTENGADCVAKKPVTKKQYPCIKKGKHYFLGFPHLYYPSNPSFAENFVKKVEEYRTGIRCK